MAPAQTEAPAKSATRAEWDTYAKSQGLTDDEIAGYKTKPALQEALEDRASSSSDLVDDDSASDATSSSAAGGESTPTIEGGVAPPTAPPNATTLDNYVDAPSTVAPGDAPADTTDPDERASSATPDFAAAAQAGHGTVNAVVPVKRGRRAAAAKAERIERYDAVRPDGKIATVEHNIDTGATEVVEVRDPD